tara:strand:+ start:122 stop:802 length:681 start_codon:yes stop_codon:yes gene_type:complete
MKKLILILLFIPIVLNSQNFDINDFINLDESANNGNKIMKSAEALIFQNGIRMIKKKQEYEYWILKNCDVGSYLEDGRWRCRNSSSYSDANGNYNFKYKQQIPHNNYEENKWNTSNFAKNYNSVNETATTWVQLTAFKRTSNDNKDDEFILEASSFFISIQFSEKTQYSYLKNGIINLAEYDYTPDVYYGDYPPVNYIYKKGERIIRFTFTESDKTSTIKINYRFK